MTMVYTDSSSSCSDEPLVSYQEDTKDVPHYNHYNSLIRKFKQNCDICDKVFPDRYSAIVHNNSHIIIPLIKISVVQCSKCYKLEPSKEDLYLHMILEHQDVELQEKITNKIVFEEDIFDDVQVKVEEDDGYDDINDDILGVEHFDDGDENAFRNLIKFGLHKCQFCNDIYSNRYKLLQHNIEHMTINTRNEHLCGHCETYFETDCHLERHLVEKHDGVVIKCMQHCYTCNLPYSDMLKHFNHYHLPPETVSCQHCKMDIKKSDIRKHMLEHQDTMHICNTCHLFVKNSNNIRYVKVGTISEQDKRGTCRKCGHAFFELNIIRKVRLYNFRKQRYSFVKPTLNSFKNKSTKKPLSNMERLKNIQSRLKFIKHLNKF